jgi:hypothetical protein
MNTKRAKKRYTLFDASTKLSGSFASGMNPPITATRRPSIRGVTENSMLQCENGEEEKQMKIEERKRKTDD